MSSIRHIGRYAMSAEIAAGGMASVHLGRLIASAGFARTVVMKRMLPELADNKEFVAMFVDEACLAARVRHPNVVTTLDVIREGSELLIVMEYVHGASLETLLQRSSDRAERVPIAVASALLSQGLLGLHAAHTAVTETGEQLRVVHRDFSPHNLLVDIHGVARVADFGVAKARQKLHKTKTGQVKGKWAYMSPEQVAGEAVDLRSDIFAAGIVLWESLTLSRLYDDPHPAKVATAIAFTEPEPPSRYAPDVPPELDAVVLRALAKDPDDRFPDAPTMAEAIRQACPPADGLTVGAWVTGLVDEQLKARAALVSELERATLNTPQIPSSATVSLLEESGIPSGVGAEASRPVPPPTRRDTPIIELAAATRVSDTGMAVVAPTGMQDDTLRSAANTRVSDTGLAPSAVEIAEARKNALTATISEDETVTDDDTISDDDTVQYSNKPPMTAAPRGVRRPAITGGAGVAAVSHSAPASGDVATVVREPAAGTIPPTLEAAQQRRSFRAGWILLAVVLALGAGGGLWWYFVWNQPSRSTTAGKKTKSKKPAKSAAPSSTAAPTPPEAAPAVTASAQPGAAVSSAPSTEPPPAPARQPKGALCASPYYTRPDGVRVYRPECFPR